MTTLYFFFALAMHLEEHSTVHIFSAQQTYKAHLALNLDTDVTVADATCANTPDGSITLSPQTGISPYTYQWSIPGNMATQSGLLPGIYQVTVTDNVGTTEELVIVVGTSPGTPQAQGTNFDGCSFNAQEEFDLTTVEDIVNMGTGLEVNWYEHPDLTGEILFPETFFTGGTTVYAVVDNGSCQSAPVAVVLTLYPIPLGNETTISVCDDDTDGFAYFDLTTVNDIISGGNGVVSWYLSNNLTNPILDPANLWSHTQYVYAHVFDGHCLSPPTSIRLEVLPYPEGIPIDTHFCGDASGQTVLDLTALDPVVSAGVGTTSWYLDPDALTPIINPHNFSTTTTTVYAVITNVICASLPFPVELIIDPSPESTAISISACDNGTNTAQFTLTDADDDISGGTGLVTWFMDVNATIPIATPGAYTSPSGIVYATVDNGQCLSGPVPIQLQVIDEPIANPATISACADLSGQAIYNLTNVEAAVNTGPGTVLWFQDAAGTLPILTPTAYVSIPGIVYAQINEAGCLSALVPVDLILLDGVMATPSQLAVCDDGSGMPFFDLTLIENTINNGIGVVSWYLDPAGTIQIPLPAMHASSNATIYAQVTSGMCVSAIVQVQLEVLTAPIAAAIAIDTCGDINGQIILDLTSYDALISANTGAVTWYADAGQNTIITNPGNYQTGTTIVYAIVDNGLCSSAVTAIDIEVGSNIIAQSATLQLCVTDLDTPAIDLTAYEAQISGGAGNVIWFTDAITTDTLFTTTTYSPTGDPLFAIVQLGKCVSQPVTIPVELHEAFTPQASCAFVSGDSVSMTWTDVADLYELTYLINDQYVTGPIMTTDTAFHLGGLMSGDNVTLIVSSDYNAICNTLLTDSVTCVTELCPEVQIQLLSQDTFCSQANPTQMEIITNGLTNPTTIIWSGVGITDPSGIYDPSLVSESDNTVFVNVKDGECTYVDSFQLHSMDSPVASFVIQGSPCVDSTLELLFNGSAFFGGSDWNWDFDGAEILPHTRPVDFYLIWDHPGDYEVTLFIDWIGCVSDTFRLPVTIGKSPDPFLIECQYQDNDEVVVSWEPVAGATSFAGTSTEGAGSLSGNIFTVTGLDENTLVDIKIEAFGSGGCGSSIATVRCQTTEDIRPLYYLPNVFSPNGDGVNDHFFVQTNNSILLINDFAIYDRWGNVVFEDHGYAPNDSSHGWDGMYQEKPINPGVFLYRAALKTEDGKVINLTGDITLVR